MKNCTKSIYFNLTLLSVFFLLVSANGFGQVEEDTKENQKLIREGATYIGASALLDFNRTKLPNGITELNINFGGNVLHAFSDYFAFGGEVAVSGFNSSNDFESSAWLIAIGPSLGFFIPNESLFTPYINVSGGYTHSFIGSSELSKGGNFYSGSIGLIYEINHFLGVGLAYEYTKFNQPSELNSVSVGGFALGFLFSF